MRLLANRVAGCKEAAVSIPVGSCHPVVGVHAACRGSGIARRAVGTSWYSLAAGSGRCLAMAR